MWFILEVLFFIVVILYVIKVRQNNTFWKHVMAIPGPRSLPLIGTAYHLDSPEEIFNRDRSLFKKYFPIYKKFTFGIAIVNLVQPEDIQLVLTNSKHNNKSIFYNFLQDWLGVGILTSQGETWHKRRKLLTPAFHFNILEDFLHIFNKETEHLVDFLKKECHKPYIDVVQPITEFTLFSIGESSFGKDLRQEPESYQYLQAVHDYGEEFVYRIIRPWMFNSFLYKLSSMGRRHEKTLEFLHGFSEKIIKERTAIFDNNTNLDKTKKKRMILLDLMLAAKNTGADIDDIGIKNEVNGFIFGGHDTTSVALYHALMLLANEPEVQTQLYDEIISEVDDPKGPSFYTLSNLQYMDRCIKECLRICPSIPTISRIAGEDFVTKDGYTVPKGCNIRIFIHDVHRNPEIWPDPEKFDPDRFLPENISKRHPYSYIPFSTGSRNCLGQRYGLLELKVALCGIIRHFKMEPVTKLQDMRHKADIVLRPACEIRVKFIPRN